MFIPSYKTNLANVARTLYTVLLGNHLNFCYTVTQQLLHPHVK